MSWRALVAQDSPVDEIPPDLLDDLPPDVVQNLRDGVIDKIPDDVIDRLPTDVVDRLPPGLVDFASQNPTLAIILAVIGVLALVVFVWGIVKSAFKAAMFGAVAAAVAWFFFFQA